MWHLDTLHVLLPYKSADKTFKLDLKMQTFSLVWYALFFQTEASISNAPLACFILHATSASLPPSIHMYFAAKISELLKGFNKASLEKNTVCRLSCAWVHNMHRFCFAGIEIRSSRGRFFFNAVRTTFLQRREHYAATDNRYRGQNQNVAEKCSLCILFQNY